MTTLTFRVPDSLAEELEKMCEEQDRTKSWFMKKALEEKMEEWRSIRKALKETNKHNSDLDISINHKYLLRKPSTKREKE